MAALAGAATAACSADDAGGKPTGGETSHPPDVPDALAALVDAMQAGGVVLYLRHPATDRGGVDDVNDPREQQRLLSAEGEQQAADLGAAFTAHTITAGKVLTSPFWRCRDAATIAFGRGEVDDQLMGLLSDETGRAERLTHSLDLLSQPVPAGEVTVLIGHTSNIAESTGETLEEGGGVLVRPGAGSFQALGTFLPDDWATLAG